MHAVTQAGEFYSPWRNMDSYCGEIWPRDIFFFAMYISLITSSFTLKVRLSQLLFKADALLIAFHPHVGFHRYRYNLRTGHPKYLTELSYPLRYLFWFPQQTLIDVNLKVACYNLILAFANCTAAQSLYYTYATQQPNSFLHITMRHIQGGTGIDGPSLCRITAWLWWCLCFW